MPASGPTSKHGESGKGGGVLPALCSILGVLLLVAVLVLTAAFVLPPLFGQAPTDLGIPFLDYYALVFESTVGKLYLVLTAACGVMLIMLANRLRESARTQTEGRSSFSKRAKNAALIGVIVVLLAVFLGSAGVIAYTNWQYHESDSLYTDARNAFTEESDKPTGILDNKPPITVDFANLQSRYPDVVGWLYCEGTPINYPIVQGTDNDFYLTHDYTGDFNINGAIFVNSEDTLAAKGKTILYGHHMQSGSMFASLLDWSDQSFYDEHPTMWLLTPEQNYKVELFSGHHTDAHSNLYVAVHEPGDELEAYLVSAQSLSDFKTSVRPDPKGRYIMLSTCAYLFDDDRYVLHGMLVPVS